MVIEIANECKLSSPSFGTDDAVGGAASTRMRSRNKKLENRLIAAMDKHTIFSLSHFIKKKRIMLAKPP